MTRPYSANLAAVTVLSALAACTLLVASACPETGAASQPDSGMVIRPPRVASVRISPDSVTLPAGALALVEATVTDGQDSILRNRPVLWTSDQPDVATVNPGGLITGVSPGLALLHAMSEGVVGNLAVTVTEPVESPWPHEPIGFRPVEDEPWSVLDTTRWTLQWGTATIVPDPEAPFSPPLALQITYPPGFEGGSAPGTMELVFPGKRALYAGIWWKPSDPWQGHPSNVNKIQFLFAQNGGPTYMALYGTPGGPYDLRILPSFPGLKSEWYKPNVKDIPVKLGAWHRIEWLVVYNTTTDPPNGMYRWWLDGELVGDHTDVAFPDTPLNVYKVSPTWGGIGVLKTETDFYRYDHIRVSGR